MSMDEFTRWNTPSDGNRQGKSTQGAPLETDLQNYEEAVSQAMSQAGTTDRRKVVRLLTNSSIEDIRRRARAELELPPEDDLEEENGPDPDPRVTMLERAKRLSREKGIALTEALVEVKLKDPALLCRVANYGPGPYEYRLAEPPRRSAPSYTLDELPAAGSVRADVPIDEGMRARIGLAAGLGPNPAVSQIHDKIDTFGPAQLRRLARALGLPETAAIEDVHTALDRMLRPGATTPDDAAPDDDAELARRHPGYAPRPGVQRAPTPNSGHYHGAERGVRAQLTERAQRLADERQIDYVEALRQLVATDPDVYQRALAEF